MRIISIIVLHLISLIGYGQNTYKGKLIDSQSQEALPYVNIGIIGKNIGTVSNIEGAFSLEIPEGYEVDTLKISMVGYHPLLFIVSDFQQVLSENNTLALEEDAAELEEIIVSSTALKTKTLGNQASSGAMSGGFTSNVLGNEVGVRIKIKRSPTYIQDFNAFIVKNKYDNLKFRLNFYNLKDGVPYQRILKEDIIISTSQKKGNLAVDLKPYNIVVEEDFFVSIEWIEDLGTNGLFFSAGVFGRTGFYRETSQGNWKKMGGTISVGFNVTAEY